MMKREYKFALQRGHAKIVCPQCGRRTFVPYVLNDGTNANVVDADRYGRCDREQNCGYYCYPKKEFAPVDFKPLPPPPPRKPDFIDFSFVLNSMQKIENQTLYRYFSHFFTREQLQCAWADYMVGTAREGRSIFWQRDANGDVRTGKIMTFKTDGHRDKQHFGTWAHKKVGKADFSLVQCLFGEHLLKLQPLKPVALVESEKTALIMSIIRPQYVWLATGGKQNMQATRLAPLANRDVVLFPDKGCASEWANKLPSAKVDYTVEFSDLDEGADILDFYEKKGFATD